ncbi:hypothetical protein L7F22_056276 [Adiantum nelumboides]|nr:hypothetical protein [Adiantum nelumboides]
MAMGRSKAYQYMQLTLKCSRSFPSSRHSASLGHPTCAEPVNLALQSNSAVQGFLLSQVDCGSHVTCTLSLRSSGFAVAHGPISQFCGTQGRNNNFVTASRLGNPSETLFSAVGKASKDAGALTGYYHLYWNIGVQPGFECAAGSYGMPGVNMGIAGFSQPYAQNMDMTGRTSGTLVQGCLYDNLTSKGNPKDYKEGGQAVKFDTFHGTHDKLKAFLFLQQFDAAFAGRNFTEFSNNERLPLFENQCASMVKEIEGQGTSVPKLSMRYYGSFQVCDKINDVAYRLKLREGCKIHNAFHVSLLRPFVGEVPENVVPKEQLEVEELDEILVPEQILAHKERKVRGKVVRRYLVKFKNYLSMDANWMEELNWQIHLIIATVS